MYVVIWSYQVKPQHIRLFLEHYHPDGIWAGFFRQSPEYISTDLLVHESDPAHYYTIDRWHSQASFELFLKENEAKYKALDARCETFTYTEKLIGKFMLV